MRSPPGETPRRHRERLGDNGQLCPVTGLSALLVIGASRPELKELNGSMTTPEVTREIEELRKDCANYMEKLERIKSATNHVTPEEKEKVKSCLGLSTGVSPVSPVRLTVLGRGWGVCGCPGCSAEPVPDSV